MFSCRVRVGCFTLIGLNYPCVNKVSTEMMKEVMFQRVSNKYSLNPVRLVMRISYYSANYQQLSPCQSSR